MLPIEFLLGLPDSYIALALDYYAGTNRYDRIYQHLISDESGREDSTASTLPVQRIENRSRQELNHSIASLDWHESSRGCFLYANGEYTGIHIIQIYMLLIGKENSSLPTKGLSLKHPSFRIGFRPTVDKGYDIIEAPTLSKAKHLAEWYYREWLKVNNKAGTL